MPNCGRSITARWLSGFQSTTRGAPGRAIAAPPVLACSREAPRVSCMHFERSAAPVLEIVPKIPGSSIQSSRRSARALKMIEVGSPIASCSLTSSWLDRLRHHATKRSAARLRARPLDCVHGRRRASSPMLVTDARGCRASGASFALLRGARDRRGEPGVRSPGPRGLLVGSFRVLSLGRSGRTSA